MPRGCSVVAGPRSGLRHEHNCHTTLPVLSISTACTGAFRVSMGVLFHSLYQLVMSVLPFFSRTDFCGWVTPNAVLFTSHRVCPMRFISRMWPLRPVMRMLPLSNSTADHGPNSFQRYTSRPSLVYSPTKPMAMLATSNVPRDVRRALRNCPCTDPFSGVGRANSPTMRVEGISITTTLAGRPFCTNTTC